MKKLQRKRISTYLSHQHFTTSPKWKKLQLIKTRKVNQSISKCVKCFFSTFWNNLIFEVFLILNSLSLFPLKCIFVFEILFFEAFSFLNKFFRLFQSQTLICLPGAFFVYVTLFYFWKVKIIIQKFLENWTFFFYK